MTNSVVAVLDGGSPVAIPNAEGSLTTPSAVAFARNGGVLVGEVAKRQVVTNQGRTVQSVKGQLGTDWIIKVDRKRFTTPQISAFILQKLKQDAEAELSGRITDAVLTVPAYFTDGQRRAIAQAAEIAGLNVLRIINEPTSAALAYHLEEQDGARLLVFALGGGTFDVSVLTVRQGVVEVQATSGDNRLGGLIMPRGQPGLRAQPGRVAEPGDVADLGDRAGHRADPGQLLDRAVGVVPGQQVGAHLPPAR